MHGQNHIKYKRYLCQTEYILYFILTMLMWSNQE